jgi:hypothetical protein
MTTRGLTDEIVEALRKFEPEYQIEDQILTGEFEINVRGDDRVFLVKINVEEKE